MLRWEARCGDNDSLLLLLFFSFTIRLLILLSCRGNSRGDEDQRKNEVKIKRILSLTYCRNRKSDRSIYIVVDIVFIVVAVIVTVVDDIECRWCRPWCCRLIHVRCCYTVVAAYIPLFNPRFVVYFYIHSTCISREYTHRTHITPHTRTETRRGILYHIIILELFSRFSLSRPLSFSLFLSRARCRCLAAISLTDTWCISCVRRKEINMNFGSKSTMDQIWYIGTQTFRYTAKSYTFWML